VTGAAEQFVGRRLLLGTATCIGGVAIGAASVRSPLLVLVAAVGLVFVALTAAELAAGLAVFTTLIFLEQIPSLSTSGLTLTKFAGGVLALVWAITAARRRATAPLLTDRHPALAYCALVLLGWTFASMLWATDPTTAGLTALRFTQGTILIFVVFSAIREKRHLIWVIDGFLVGAVLTAIVGLAGVTGAEGTDAAMSDRLTGSIGDPNELAAILLPALSLALFMLATSDGALRRFLLVAVAVTCVVALVRTESRGGLIGLGAMLLAGLVFSGPVRARAATIVLAVSGFAVAYFTLVAPPQSLGRLTSFGAGGGSGRTDLWSVALDITRNHPLAGIGAGNFQLVEPAYALHNRNLPRFDLIVDTSKVVHNMYLNALVELGVVGLCLFMLLIVYAFTSAFRAVSAFARTGDREMELLARGIIIGTIGMLVAFFFLSAQYEKQLPLLLGMLAALSSLGPSRITTRTGPQLVRGAGW